MSLIKRTSGIVIPKENNEDLCQRVKTFLTRRTKDFNDNIIINTYFLESEKYLKIPRYFPLHNFTSVEIEDQIHPGDDIEINHTIVPRNESQKLTMDYMLNSDNGLIQLEPGAGKTVITIRTVAERKKKSFILVHRDSLADQWRDRFLQFTDLKEEHIVRLSSKTFLEDLKSSVVIGTAQTFLSLLDRKREEFLLALNEARFGIFVGDEVHTAVGAPTFSECSLHIPTKVNFGLSATPDRHDGSGDVIKFHLGEVFADSSSDGTMKAKVIMATCDFGIDIPYRHKWLYWQGKFQRSRYLNMMEKSLMFDQVVRQMISKLESENRNSLIVCERLSLLDKLFTYVVNEDKKMFTAGNKNINLEAQYVFSTPGKIRDGVDAPWKDALIMTSPISNIAQICGRIVRLHKDKKMPIIFDIVDSGCKLIGCSSKKRIEYYESKDWDIVYVSINDHGKKVIDKKEFLKIAIR